MNDLEPEMREENIGRLVKQRVFDLVGYKVRTQEVADFHSSLARTRIVHAPARTSKSYAAAHEALYHCFPPYEQLEDKRFAFFREPTGDRRIWLIGPDYRTIKEWDYLWDILVVRKKKLPLGNMYKIVAKTNNAHQGNLRILMEFPPDRDGNPVRVYVEGKSASSPESLQGEQVYLAVLSEAAEHDEKVLGRYLGTRTLHTILPTTPKLSAEWLRRLIEDGTEHPELSIESFQFTPYANPHYDWDLYWIEHAKAEARSTGQITTPSEGHDCFADPAGCAARRDPWFAEQFCGEWTGADERLLPFGTANLLDAVPAWIRDGAPRTFVSCDYGYADAAVALFWAIGERDGLVIVAEVYEQHLTATDFVAAVHAKSDALGIRPDYYVGDPKQPQIARLLRDRGLPVWDVDKKAMADRAAGFHAIVDALTIDPMTGVPRLRLVNEEGNPWGCPHTIHEWKHLRRKSERNATGEFAQGAVCGDDHAADACRYGIMTRPQPKVLRVDDDIRRYVESLRRRTARPSAPSSVVGRLVGGAPRMIASGRVR